MTMGLERFLDQDVMIILEIPNLEEQRESARLRNSARGHGDSGQLPGFQSLTRQFKILLLPWGS